MGTAEKDEPFSEHGFLNRAGFRSGALASQIFDGSKNLYPQQVSMSESPGDHLPYRFGGDPAGGVG